MSFTLHSPKNTDGTIKRLRPPYTIIFGRCRDGAADYDTAETETASNYKDAVEKAQDFGCLLDDLVGDWIGESVVYNRDGDPLVTIRKHNKDGGER
jgi:hypothetical protein